MGDLLFAIANLARKLGVEPESALRQADDKFARRFTELEHRFAARGESLKDAGLARMEEEWGRIKDAEPSAAPRPPAERYSTTRRIPFLSSASRKLISSPILTLIVFR